MVLSPELLLYAENIWHHFPELFLTLGAMDFENEFHKDRHIDHQLFESSVIIRIVLHRQRRARLEGSPSPCSTKCLTTARKEGLPQAPDCGGEAKNSGSYRQHCLTEVFNTHKLKEVFNSRKRTKGLGSTRKRTEPRLCQCEAADCSHEKHPEPWRRHFNAMGIMQTWRGKSRSCALSPSDTTLSADGIDSPFGSPIPWTRQCSSSSAWSNATSSLAIHRGMEHLAHVVTRPPPAFSPLLVRAPALGHSR